MYAGVQISDRIVYDGKGTELVGVPVFYGASAPIRRTTTTKVLKVMIDS